MYESSACAFAAVCVCFLAWAHARGGGVGSWNPKIFDKVPRFEFCPRNLRFIHSIRAQPPPPHAHGSLRTFTLSNLPDRPQIESA